MGDDRWAESADHREPPRITHYSSLITSRHATIAEGVERRREDRMVRSAMIGARVRRKEDPRLITGTSMYVGDMQVPNMLHLILLRSPFAHARIRSIDTSAAKELPGVAAVYTLDDYKAFGPAMPGGGSAE